MDENTTVLGLLTFFFDLFLLAVHSCNNGTCDGSWWSWEKLLFFLVLRVIYKDERLLLQTNKRDKTERDRKTDEFVFLQRRHMERTTLSRVRCDRYLI